MFQFLLSLSFSLTLPQIIGDNMVLQQNTNVRIWGQTIPHVQVEIIPSWANIIYTTNANSEGLFDTLIRTPEASYQTHTITISDGNKQVLSNILVGEVWFTSGQSNMKVSLNGYVNCPIKHAQSLIADSKNHPNVRLVTLEYTTPLEPQLFANGKWLVPSSSTATGFSAVGYQYALYLEKILKVPIGVITCAWGGSRVEGWLPREILETFPDENLSRAADPDYPAYLKPMVMYNGCLYPTSKYTIKGIAWYQGESNEDKAELYIPRLQLLVDHWRKLWGLGEIPFYIIELAPYNFGNNLGALFRETQFRASKLISNSAFVCTNDLAAPFEVDQVHPENKGPVAHRLAFHALQKVYRIPGIVADNPYFQRFQVLSDQVKIWFYNSEGGFSPWLGIKGFEVAGNNHQFFPANATINDDGTISVFSTEVSQPVAVRYCFHDFEVGNVYTPRGLPLIPFRTDDWNDAFERKAKSFDTPLFTPRFLKAISH